MTALTLVDPAAGPIDDDLDRVHLLELVVTATRAGGLTLLALAGIAGVQPHGPGWDALAAWFVALDGTWHPDGGVLRYEAAYGRLCRHDSTPADAGACHRPGQGDAVAEDLFLHRAYGPNQPITMRWWAADTETRPDAEQLGA